MLPPSQGRAGWNQDGQDGTHGTLLRISAGGLQKRKELLRIWNLKGLYGTHEAKAPAAQDEFDCSAASAFVKAAAAIPLAGLRVVRAKRQVMIKTSELLQQGEGVQLWRSTSSETPFFIRTLRTRDTWEAATEAEAAEIYDLEVARSRDCPVVQKKLGSF